MLAPTSTATPFVRIRKGARSSSVSRRRRTVRKVFLARNQSLGCESRDSETTAFMPNLFMANSLNGQLATVYTRFAPRTRVFVSAKALEDSLAPGSRRDGLRVSARWHDRRYQNDCSEIVGRQGSE